MTNAPIGEQIDDPLNDGVELVEDLQGQAGLPTGDRMDVAKIRIEKLNQERQERVARRRDPQSCLKRGLHRIIPYGGIISSGCNLASSSLGAGILALPYAFNTSGLAMALVYLVVVGLLTIYSFTLLGIAGKRTGLRNYEQVTRALLGKGADYFLAFLLWLLSFGAEVSYVISMGDVVEAFVQNSPNSSEYLKSSSGRRLLTSMVWLVAMLPLCLPREICI